MVRDLIGIASPAGSTTRTAGSSRSSARWNSCGIERRLFSNIQIVGMFQTKIDKFRQNETCRFHFSGSKPLISPFSYIVWLSGALHLSILQLPTPLTICGGGFMYHYLLYKLIQEAPLCASWQNSDISIVGINIYIVIQKMYCAKRIDMLYFLGIDYANCYLWFCMCPYNL